MKVLVSDEAHIYRLPDGSCWTDAINGYEFYKRYLDVFKEIKLVAKTKDVKELDKKCLRVDGPHLEVYGIPFFQGPIQFFKNIVSIYLRLEDVDKDCDVAILRMPSVTSSMVYRRLRKRIPLGGEIIYDPYNDIHGNYNSTLIKLIWMLISRDLKHFCLNANGVSYVTKRSIQNHYPNKAMLFGDSELFFQSYYSSITLKNEAYGSYREFKNIEKLTLVMSDVAMNNDRKGEDVFIRVIKECRNKGMNIYGIIIGDGSRRKLYEELVRKLGLHHYVTFTGLFPSSDDVRRVMEKADVFLFPTKAEGLPRGILEAMAIGLPVISTPVGGIPEIIDSKYLLKYDDIDGFVDLLSRLYVNCGELTQMSKSNFNTSKEFSNTVLQNKRNCFYMKLRDLTNKVNT